MLHVLTEIPSNVKGVIGIDKSKVFTRTKIESNEKRPEVSLSRELGQCGKLTLDVDGSIFTSNFNKKSESDYKALANIFGKRITNDLKIKNCHFCECEGHNSGTAFMTCISCDKQSSATDYVRINIYT